MRLGSWYKWKEEFLAPSSLPLTWLNIAYGKLKVDSVESLILHGWFHVSQFHTGGFQLTLGKSQCSRAPFHFWSPGLEGMEGPWAAKERLRQWEGLWSILQSPGGEVPASPQGTRTRSATAYVIELSIPYLGLKSFCLATAFLSGQPLLILFIHSHPILASFPLATLSLSVSTSCDTKPLTSRHIDSSLLCMQ